MDGLMGYMDLYYNYEMVLVCCTLDVYLVYTVLIYMYTLMYRYKEGYLRDSIRQCTGK